MKVHGFASAKVDGPQAATVAAEFPIVSAPALEVAATVRGIAVNSAGDRINALTGLRFFAAFAIVLYHLPGVLWLAPGSFPLALHLNLGVSFFFVLSGFILQHSYRSRMEAIAPWRFVALRFFRIWPCHIAVLLLILLANRPELLNDVLHRYSIGQLLAVIFLLQAWSPDMNTVFALNSPSWSISTELFFYAMFPLLCRQALIGPLRPFYLATASTVLWLTAIWLYMPAAAYEAVGGINPLARVLEFATGISTYECVRQTKQWMSGGTIQEVAAIALVAVYGAATSYGMPWIGATFGPQSAWWFDNTASFWTFAIVIAVFFRHQGLLSRFIGWKPVVFLGDVSFALYLAHQPVIMYLAHESPWFQKISLGGQVALFAAIAFGISAGLHLIVEKPCMSLAKLILRPQRLAAA